MLMPFPVKAVDMIGIAFHTWNTAIQQSMRQLLKIQDLLIAMIVDLDSV